MVDIDLAAMLGIMGLMATLTYNVQIVP